MNSLAELDNEVQESGAVECKRTGNFPSHYEKNMAYITLKKDRALLHYFGTGVNTEWDELCTYSNGEWHVIAVDRGDCVIPIQT